MSLEKSKEGTKERSPDSLSLPNQNTILINIKWYYFTWYAKKIQWNPINKKQNRLERSKNYKSSTLPQPKLDCDWSLALLVFKDEFLKVNILQPKLDCDWSLFWFLEMNFSKLTYCNQSLTVIGCSSGI